MNTTSDAYKQIYIVACLFGVVITLFTGVYFFLSTFETIRIYGKVTDGTDNVISNIPVYIYFDGILTGVIQSSNSSNLVEYNFVYQLNNEIGLTSGFPGSGIDIDFGTVPVDTTNVITRDNVAIEVRAGTSFNNGATVQGTDYFNSRNVKFIIGGVISISITIFLTYFLIRMSNSQESIKVIETTLLDIPKAVVMKGNNDMSPEIVPIAIPFLIEVGRFAMKVLKHRWIISRGEGEKQPKIDLANEEDIKAKLPSQLGDSEIWRKLILNNHLNLLQKEMVRIPRDETVIDIAERDGNITPRQAARQRDQIKEDVVKTSETSQMILEQLGFQISKEQLE